MLPLHTGPLKKCVEGPLTLAPGSNTTTPPQGGLRIGHSFPSGIPLKGLPIWLKITVHWSKAAAPSMTRCLVKVQWRVERGIGLFFGPGDRRSEVGPADDKLLPLISPWQHRHIVPVIHFTSQHRSRYSSLACQLGGQRYCYAYYTDRATESSTPPFPQFSSECRSTEFWRPTDWDYLLISPNLK